MASLFEGSPQTATSYTTSNTESPKWLQDAIYNQIQVAQHIAKTPYQEYAAPRVAELSPLQQQAYKQVQKNQGAWKPEMNFASTGMQDFASKGTAEGLTTAQGQYLRPDMVSQTLGAGQDYFGQAGSTTAEALSDRALNAADPYLQAAAGTAAGGISDYMSPYQSGVMDVLAKQGARNLTENLLPGVSDQFIRAGQFGSGRMGEFGSRALRDTQEAVLNQQAQLANQGYGQALTASQNDLARQAQLASTVGSISGADLSRVLQGGAQYGSLGQAQTAAGQAQQQYGLTAAQNAQQAQAADYQRQMGALNSVANMAQQAQGMRAGDVASLEAAGSAQQGQQQQQLNAAYEQSQAPQNYLKNQADWLNTQVRGMAPLAPTSTTGSGTTTGATYGPSGLSQLATSYYAGKGLSSI